jgi:hypothetical protein
MTDAAAESSVQGQKTPRFLWSDPAEPYLMRLRAEYDLERVAGEADHYARACAATAWVHGRWRHDGNCPAALLDPLAILRAAEAGASFRCMEYAVVLCSVLNALGIPARQLIVMTHDVETREGDAAHAVTEAFLPDRRAWVMLDGQWGMAATAGGEPTSAVGLVRARMRKDGSAGAAALTGGDAAAYLAWIAPYLYFFETSFDARVPPSGDPDQPRLMLVPSGVREPVVFQGRAPMRGVVYTRFIRDFYPDLS